MKTNCNLRASLHHLTNSTPTSNNTTNYPSITTASCTGKCSACCCAILLLRYIAVCCNDPSAFSEDARHLLKKYPLD